MIVRTTKAIQRKKSTMKWGIASSHLTSHSPRLSGGESSPVSRSGGCGGFHCRTSRSSGSGDGCGWGERYVLARLRLASIRRSTARSLTIHDKAFAYYFSRYGRHDEGVPPRDEDPRASKDAAGQYLGFPHQPRTRAALHRA